MRVGALPRDRAYRRERMRQRRLFSGPLPPARTSLPNVLRLSAEGQKRRFRCGLNNSEIVGSVGKPPLNVRPLFGTASSAENGWHGREAAGRREVAESSRSAFRPRTREADAENTQAGWQLLTLQQTRVAAGEAQQPIRAGSRQGASRAIRRGDDRCCRLHAHAPRQP